MCILGFFGLVLRGMICDIHIARSLGYAVGVQNHNDTSIAKDGVSREEGEVSKNFCDGFYHDFFSVEHLVDNDAELVRADYEAGAPQ